MSDDEVLKISNEESHRKNEFQKLLEKYCKDNNIKLNEMNTSERGRLIKKLEDMLWL